MSSEQSSSSGGSAQQQQQRFDPKRHVIKVQGGREYLPVSARLVWFREAHPDWGIVTTPVEINLQPEGNRPPYAIFQATIYNEAGKVMSTATKMEDLRGFGDFLEKAETGAVGRALAYCGFGTQFAPELEEVDQDAVAAGGQQRARFADSPYAPGRGPGGPGPNRYASGPQGRPAAANGSGSGNGTAAAASRSGGGGITRVREPERPDFDPGGEHEDDEDPFSGEDEAPLAAPAAASAAPARSESRGASPLSANRCTVDGCTAVLTPAQMTMSMQKFGKLLCILHQKDAAPVAAGKERN